MKGENLEKKVLDGQKGKPYSDIWVVVIVVILTVSAIGIGILLWLKYSPQEEPADPYIYIGGVAYDRNITEIILSNSDFDDYSALNEFENLQRVDLKQLDLSPDKYDIIARKLSGKDVIWNVPFNGNKIASDIETLTLTPGISPNELWTVKYFNHLKKLNAENYPLCDELYAVMQEKTVSGSDCEFNCTSQIYGKNIDSSMNEITLSGMRISNLDELRGAIKFFPGLKKIEMCDCGLNNETMGKLRDEFPNVQFVWIVRFLDYEVRTDAHVFSTLVDWGDEIEGTQRSFAPLFRYCTELRALDLGHHYITGIDEITNLKKLQVLILGDNSIQDISPLAELKDLTYVELFMNRIDSVEPLSKLENLQELNICINGKITDAETLLNCKRLKVLYASRCGISRDTVAKLEAGLPEGCILNTTARNAIHTGWRKGDKNAAIRKAFKNWKYVEEFQDWEHIKYKDGAKLK